MAIRSFADKTTEAFFETGRCPPQWQRFQRIVARKLDMVDYAVSLTDLNSPPGNRLEALRGNRKGQHSVRINGQWRVCFVWTPDGPEDVEIVDYH